MKQPVCVVPPTGEAIPLVFDSPHSGSIYPDDFDHVIDRMTLRRSEDAHIDELFAHVVDHGATLVHALFPRCYIDPNRNADDIDLTMIAGAWPHPVNPTEKTVAQGVGLIWKQMRAFGPVYDRKLTPAEVKTRIDRYWQAYHDALAGVLDAHHAAFGRVVHIDCHSMPSHGDATTKDGPVARPDFVIGDRDGTTCAPALTECVVETLRSHGHSVAINDPYKGFELVRRHGRPVENRHAIQIEVNRALYMDEATLSKLPGFEQTETVLAAVTRQIGAIVPQL